jgi:hypothetical protein
MTEKQASSMVAVLMEKKAGRLLEINQGQPNKWSRWLGICMHGA